MKGIGDMEMAIRKQPQNVDGRKGTAHKSVQITHDDMYLFNEGRHFRLYEKLGAHLLPEDGQGTHFAVWAPNACEVSVMGDCNNWDATRDQLLPLEGSGIWHGVVARAGVGQLYKYQIRSRDRRYTCKKTDPFAFACEIAPNTASVVADLQYSWSDQDWMANRGKCNATDSPISIYEAHLGSWARVPDEGNRFLTYRELAPKLAAYIREQGFTHVELLPPTEHPFYGSWGYEPTGYFAPTSRYGSPTDFMCFVDILHQNKIGVIIDWVPAHFPSDEHGLAFFDGTHLFEHADPRKGFHPDWKSSIFNYGRHEVRSFLISSALFWLDKYHIDGLRVDAVASMLYLDYSRREGEWIPNEYGGRENIEAIGFLRAFNDVVYKEYPDVQTFAEESTSWPQVSRPTHLGGLGFGFTWDMGWMHDMLEYMEKDPIHRSYHHRNLTFRQLYASHENFLLPLSHDEVVHGKGSLLRKMHGDTWQKFANVRLLLGNMFMQPGKKLLFMGGEFGQWAEWYHEESLHWHLLREPLHKGLLRWVADLNRSYRLEPGLHVFDVSPEGFEWVDCSDSSGSTLSFLRKGRSPKDTLLVVSNFTPVPRYSYRVGVPANGYWKELLNSDAKDYGGSGQGNMGGVETMPVDCHGRMASLTITLPPLGMLLFGQCEP